MRALLGRGAAEPQLPPQRLRGLLPELCGGPGLDGDPGDFDGGRPRKLAKRPTNNCPVDCFYLLKNMFFFFFRLVPTLREENMAMG